MTGTYGPSSEPFQRCQKLRPQGVLTFLVAFKRFEPRCDCVTTITHTNTKRLHDRNFHERLSRRL